MINIYSRLFDFAGDTAVQKLRSVLKKKDTLRVLQVEGVFLRRISPGFLALGLVQDGYPSGGLDSGC